MDGKPPHVRLGCLQRRRVKGEHGTVLRKKEKEKNSSTKSFTTGMKSGAGGKTETDPLNKIRGRIAFEEGEIRSQCAQPRKR